MHLLGCFSLWMFAGPAGVHSIRPVNDLEPQLTSCDVSLNKGGKGMEQFDTFAQYLSRLLKDFY